MSALWERTDRAICTHPGWTTLRGWGKIAASFFALFSGAQQLQFVLTQESGEVQGDVAWVSVDETLLGDQGGSTVAALNVFSRDRLGDWRGGCPPRALGHRGGAP